jgi:hypothetical protein
MPGTVAPSCSPFADHGLSMLPCMLNIDCVLYRWQITKRGLQDTTSLSMMATKLTTKFAVRVSPGAAVHGQGRLWFSDASDPFLGAYLDRLAWCKAFSEPGQLRTM